jgi:hypothetical protein
MLTRPPGFAFSKYLSIVAAAATVALACAGCCQTKARSGHRKNTGAIMHHARNRHQEPRTIPPRCSPAWNQLVDSRLRISDDAEHGPDIGSAEWMNAVGIKSGVVDAQGHGPDPGSDEWCRAVDYNVFGRR